MDRVGWIEYAFLAQDSKAVKVKISKNGEANYFSLKVSKLAIDGSERYFVVFHDITILQKYSDELELNIAKKTKELQDKLILAELSEELANIGSWEIDFDKNTYVWSKGVYKLFDLEPYSIDVGADTAYSFIHPDDLEMVKNAYKEALKGDGKYKVENRVILRDGTIRHVEAFGRIDKDGLGKATKMYGVMQDITDEKQALELKEKNLKLEAEHYRLESLSKMLASVAHHWRNPLTGIYMMIDSIEERLSVESREDYVTEFRMVKGRIQELSSAITRFTELSRSKPNKDNFSLLQNVEKIIELFRPTFDFEKIELSINIHDIELYGDKNGLTKTLSILFQNSIDAIVKKREELQREFIGMIEISSSFNEKALTLSIKDNGIGISKENNYRLFEPYFTTKFRAKDIGLSLFIAKEMIDKGFGGEIRNIECCDGACFEIIIPLKEAL